MPADCTSGESWTREHDNKGQPLLAGVPRTCYPQSLRELIELCRDRQRSIGLDGQPTGLPDQRLHAAGSHWALSLAAISDNTFIETHDPNDQKQAMGRTLHNIVPKCINENYLDWLHDRTSGDEPPHSFAHVEAGKRIYQLYAGLDQPIDPNDEGTLSWLMRTRYQNERFGGRWALATMGTAGGQTIVGALTTGTHGGDFDRPPIADYVWAIHLVADGGKHYWIERENEPDGAPPLTDAAKLEAEYSTQEFGGTENFAVIRDDDMFNAVLVSVGRFGVIYSVILRVVPQHNIAEQRRISIWQNIKKDIKDLDSWIYKGPPPTTPIFWIPKARFLMIPILLTPSGNFQQNLAALTWRWERPLTPNPGGRDQRVGNIVDEFDPKIQAPRFSNAGNNHPYKLDPDDPTKQATPGFIDNACRNGSFIAGAIGEVIGEIEDFVTSEGVIIGATLGTVLLPGVGGAVLLIPALLLLLAWIRGDYAGRNGA